MDHVKAKDTEHTIVPDYPAGDSLHISSMVDLLAALEEVGQHAIEPEFRLFYFFLRQEIVRNGVNRGQGYIDYYGSVVAIKEYELN